MSNGGGSSVRDLLLQYLGGVQLWSPSTRQHADPIIVSNKLVLLYFSAHFCGPCRRFTPQLIQIHKELKERVGQGDGEDFELIFCSMDRSQQEYEAYTADMPWWCLPYDASSSGTLNQMLAHRCGAVGIPHLVVLDKDAERTVLVRDAVGELTVDPRAQNFPWRPRPLVESFPLEYLVKDSYDTSSTRTAPMSDLDDKYLLLYMSAHWCMPCRSFTPKLVKAYQKLKLQRQDFEVS